MVDKIVFLGQLCKPRLHESLIFSPDVSILRVMIVRILIPAILAALAVTVPPGCSEADRTTAIGRNLSDAEVVVTEVRPEGGSYLLRGRVVNAVPVGGSASMAERGQEISLAPWYGEGGPDPANPAHQRLIALSGAIPGDTVRCRIAVDSGGSWRIISAH